MHEADLFHALIIGARCRSWQAKRSHSVNIQAKNRQIIFYIACFLFCIFR